MSDDKKMGYTQFINLIKDIENLTEKYYISYELLLDVVRCYCDSHFEFTMIKKIKER